MSSIQPPNSSKTINHTKLFPSSYSESPENLIGTFATFDCKEGYYFPDNKLNQAYQCVQIGSIGEWILVDGSNFSCIGMFSICFK